MSSSSRSESSLRPTRSKDNRPFVFQDCASSVGTDYHAGSEASSVRHILGSSSNNNKAAAAVSPPPPPRKTHTNNNYRPTIQARRAPPTTTVTAVTTTATEDVSAHYTDLHTTTSSANLHTTSYRRTAPLQNAHRPTPYHRSSLSAGDISSVTSASMTSASMTTTSAYTSSSSISSSSSAAAAARSAKNKSTLLMLARSSSHSDSNSNNSKHHHSSLLDRHFLNSSSSKNKLLSSSSSKRRKDKYSKLPRHRNNHSNHHTTEGSGGEGSDADVSQLTNSSCSDDEGGGFLGRLLLSTTSTSSRTSNRHNARNQSNKKKQSSTRSSSSFGTPRKNKNMPLQSQELQDDDDSNSPSWALSSPSGINSIPEEQDSVVGDRQGGGSPQLRCLDPTSIPTKTKNSPMTPPPTTCTTSKEVIMSPTSFMTSPSSSCLLNNSDTSSLPSPQSQKSLVSLLGTDTSSIAAFSVASGTTGFASDATPIIRNTNPNKKNMAAAAANDSMEAGRRNPPYSIHQNQVAPHHQYQYPHSGTILEEDYEDHHNNNKASIFRRNKNKSSNYPFCSGTTQGLVICVLTALFIFGLITVVVSFVLSQRGSAGAVDADNMLQGSTGGNGLDDDIFGGGGGDNATLADDDVFGTLAPTMVPTTAPTAVLVPEQAPTMAPSLIVNEEDAFFVDAVEDLLNDSPPPSLNPTLKPTFRPTLNPTNQPKTDAPTKRPTVVPTETPQAAGVSFTESVSLSTQSPTVTTVSPTQSPPTTLAPTTEVPTVSPTVPPPLLQPDTILVPEAQLSGEQGGDAAGSSIALSGNSQIMVMGSPNASPSELQRSGQVQVFERHQKANSKPSPLRQSTTTKGDEWEWRLRGKIPGVGAMHQLGYTVATDDDGTIVVVSQPTADSRSGWVNIYEWQEVEGAYVERQVLTGDQTDHFGISISLSGDGRRLAVGSPYHSTEAKPGESASNLRGQVQVFEYTESTQRWELMKAKDPPLFLGSASLDWLGWAVSLSKDGQILAVGAPRNTEFGGYVQCFQWSGQAWDIMGSPIINGIAPVKLDDRFGHSVSVTNTGSRTGDIESNIVRVAIGSPWKDTGDVLNSGLVAIYEWSDSQWVSDVGGALGGVITETEPGFYHQLGYTIQMAGDAIAVGVPGWDNRRGLVNLFWLAHAFSDSGDDEKSSWERLANPLEGAGAGDDFGFSVSLSLQTKEGKPTEPSSLSVAVGAIMVSASNSESTGYSQVFRVGSPSN